MHVMESNTPSKAWEDWYTCVENGDIIIRKGSTPFHLKYHLNKAILFNRTKTIAVILDILEVEQQDSAGCPLTLKQRLTLMHTFPEAYRFEQ